MENPYRLQHIGGGGATEANTMKAFMDGPFLQWLKTFPEAPAVLDFDALTSNHFLHNILQNFDSNFSPTPVQPIPPLPEQTGSSFSRQSKNSHITESSERGDGNGMSLDQSRFRAKVAYIESVVNSVKSFYEDILGQTLVVKLPNALIMCQEPPTKESLYEMDTVLLLMLGAAVQCNQRAAMVDAIRNLPVDIQEAIAVKIREVRNNPERVWTEEISRPDAGELNSQGQTNQYYLLLVNHLRSLVQQRDDFSQKLIKVTLQLNHLTENGRASNLDTTMPGSNSMAKSAGMAITPESNHQALEASEFKAQIRKLKQQLDERTETSRECKEEMEKYIAKCSKLRQENLELTQKAREARALQDELDVQRERAQKVHSLETEIQVYKDKISQFESLKSRMDEVKEENKILDETKNMLEDQLEGSRKRCQQIIGLENELYVCKSELSNCQMELESIKVSNIQLTEENSALQMSNKNSMSESQSLMAEMQFIKDTDRGNNDTNIMSEHLSQDTAKMHRLELENQRLRSEVDDLKMNGIKEQTEKCLKLERENKCQSLTIKQLHDTQAKDADHTVSLQGELNQVVTKAQQMEQVVEMLKQNESQLRVEKDMVIENLNKEIGSLRKRQQQTANEQLKFLEEENKKLVKDKTVFEIRVTKLDYENRQFVNKAKEYEATMDKADEAIREKERMGKQVESLTREIEQLSNVKEAKDTFALKHLEDDKLKLSKSNEKLRGELSNLFAENSRIKMDIQKASKKMESLRAENKKLALFETERDDLLDKIGKMSINLENLTASSEKQEDQEQKLNMVTFENSRLNRQNQTLNRKLEEMEVESRSVESENQKLQKTIENLKSTARRVEQLEKENFELESNQHKLDRENKSMVREVDRLKQGGDIKDVAIEELNSKLVGIEREKNKLMRDLELWNGEQSKVFELEKENRKLSQSCSMDKKTLIQLRQELVDEKIKCDNLSNKMDTLQRGLQRLGIDADTLDDDEAQQLSQDRVKNLEGSMNRLLEARQKQIETQEIKLKAIKDKNMALQQQIEVLKLKAQAGDEKSGIEAQLGSVVKERDQLRTELLNIKIETNSSNKKMDLYENKFKKLQEENVQIQVENSTLQSQSTSLLSQINSLQTANVTQENSKKGMEETAKKFNDERTELLQDQADLQKLHDNLQQDYEKLMKEKESQKETERQLRSDLRKLQSMSVSLSEDQDNLLRAKEAMDVERETLRTDTRTLANLRSEHARLKDDFRSLFTVNERVKNEYCNLQTEYKALKTSYNQLKLQQTELKGELGDAKEQMTIIDVEHTKALNRCDVLSQLNVSLEEDRRSLMSQVSLLLSQYHELLTQTMDDKEHFHEEEKYFTDRMNNLSRQKEKLEEKIMEQYKKMDNSTPKKIGFGGQLVRKMKKASSNLILTSNRSRSAVSGTDRTQGPTSNGSGSVSHPQPHALSSSSSIDNNFRSDAMNNDFIDGNHMSHHSTTVAEDSCSSLNGNDIDSCNDSSEGAADHQGGRSPSPLVDRLVGLHDFMSRSESAGPDLLQKRKTSSSNLQLSSSTSFSSSAHTSMANSSSHPFNSPHLSSISQQNINPAFRRSMPPHLEDSDGNNADDDSVNSFRLSGGRHLRPNQHTSRDYSDDLPTRDVGPDRLGQVASHSELGIPIAPTQDNRSRFVSRVSINGKDVPSSNNLVPNNDYRSSVPHQQLHYQSAGWKNSSGASSGASSGVSPVHSSNEDHIGDGGGTPPTIPARKQSRSGQSDSDNASAPPQRPPKPGRPRTTGITDLSSDNRTATVYQRDDASSSTTTVEDDENIKIESNKIKENAEWYEYGCV